MNRIKIATIITALSILTSPVAFADTPLAELMQKHPSHKASDVLNQITFPLAAEQWVNTTSAKVTVGINATLKEAQIAQLRTNTLKKLEQLLPKANWNITRFERTEDSSGLVKIQVDAETRVPEASISAVQEQAKKLSTEGETYRILNVDFSPDLTEISQAKSTLRAKLFKDATDELNRLNAATSGPKYYLHDIVFSDAPVAMPVAAYTAVMAVGGAGDMAKTTTSSLTVSSKISMIADVTYATRDTSSQAAAPAKP